MSSDLATRPANLTPEASDSMQEQAMQAIVDVHDPAAAESLLRRVRLVEEAVRLADLGRTYEQRWTRVVLLGERRYGELLGPAEHGGDRRSSDTRSLDLTNGDRKDRYRARRVAAIPQEIFDAYLQMAKKPSRTGLLHYANRTERPGDIDSGDAPVVDVSAMTKRQRDIAEANRQRLNKAIHTLVGLCAGFDEHVDIARVAPVANADDFRYWETAVTNALTSLRSLRKRIQEQP